MAGLKQHTIVLKISGKLFLRKELEGVRVERLHGIHEAKVHIAVFLLRQSAHGRFSENRLL